MTAPSQSYKRGRGRPRLSTDEKQRRKELREIGLMKRSHRRTKEGTANLKPVGLYSMENMAFAHVELSKSCLSIPFSVSTYMLL